MKYLCFFISLLYVSSAYALSCAFPDVENIRKNRDSVYLIEVKSITDKTEGECYVSGNAEIEVLKIYRGDVENLQKVDKLKFSEDGNSWPNNCFKPRGFVGGEKFILFKQLKDVVSIHQGGDCYINIDMFVNDDIVKEFEKTNKPIWEK